MNSNFDSGATPRSNGVAQPEIQGASGVLARIEPSLQARPMAWVVRAAAVGFAFGVIVPVKLQMLLAARLMKFGVEKLLAKRSARQQSQIGHDASNTAW